MGIHSGGFIIAGKELDDLVNKINLILVKNEALDKERWASANKRIEDRRRDIRKLFDLVQKK